MSKKRIDNLRKEIAKNNLDGFVVTNLNHVRYLCGYTGSNGLLAITPSQAFFLTDFRYAEQAAKQVKGAKRIICTKGDLVAELKQIKALDKLNYRFGYDQTFLTLAGLEALKRSLRSALFVPAAELMTELGWVKEPSEIQNIRKACKIADTAFERILKIITPGVRERELAAELEYQMAMLGSERPAFESIVASGARGALPHGIASDKKVKQGEMITFDFGATVNGYVSDITRTVMLGKANQRQKRIYNIVLRSQKAGVMKVKPGITGQTVDSACRKIIANAGYSKQFGHGTGHGIGIIVHTGPGLGLTSTNILTPGNVVTVEPGIYIPGWGGVRIEDDVLVTSRGHELLTGAEKKLLEL